MTSLLWKNNPPDLESTRVKPCQYVATQDASNVPEILESILEMNRNPNTKIKVLGVLWDSVTDQLMFDIKFKEDDLKKENQETRREDFDTKRNFLEDSATIFDPQGLLAPRKNCYDL
jgi:hypothetical protein